jgi:hypothetical protein
MTYATVNRFRIGRGRVLRRLIEALARHLGRDIAVLDVGGRPDYWENVGVGGVARIDLLNISENELDRALPGGMPPGLFTSKVGDARNLADYPDKSVDLVHSNSVIEHVGPWPDMATMAREMLRVGVAGWVQTPAWEFPIEPHFSVPFMHWFARPVQARMMWLSANRFVRQNDFQGRRINVDRINLLSRGEVRALFPEAGLYVERVIFPKSYSAYWLPEGLPSPVGRSAEGGREPVPTSRDGRVRGYRLTCNSI